MWVFSHRLERMMSDQQKNEQQRQFDEQQAAGRKAEASPQRVQEEKDRRDGTVGEPAGIEEFKDGDETNLPDNPAFTAPESVDDSM